MQNGGQLSQSTMYERGRTGAMQTKERGIKRLQVELMSQKSVFRSQLLGIFILKVGQQTGLSEQEGFHLQEIAPMLGDGGKGQAASKPLEGIVVQPESEMTS